VLSPKDALRWGFLTGLTLGSLLFIYAITLRVHLSHKIAVNQIYVGMTRDDARRILQSNSIECALADAAEPHASGCRFQDAWHSYVIAIDPKTDRVGRKSISSRGPLLSDLVRWIRGPQP